MNGLLLFYDFFGTYINLGLYVYFSFVFMSIAKKTQTGPLWLAWVPLLQYKLTAKIAKKSAWPLFLIIPILICAFIITIFIFSMAIMTDAESHPPFSDIVIIIACSIVVVSLIILTVYLTIWQWKMFQALSRPGWWALSFSSILLIFFVGIILIPVGLYRLYKETWVLFILINVLVYGALLGIAAWSNKKDSTTNPN